MRRLLLLAVVGLVAGGVGCKHIGGRCDCTHNPDDARLPSPGNVYPAIGSPVGGVIASPAPAAVAPTPAPVPVPEKLPLPK
jgi:hypothetical protein